MLTTPNFKLKKIELTDSPPDITVINFNWDTLDTNLKEALDGARGWDTFSKNGGSIGSKVTLGVGQDKGLYFGANFRTWGGTDEWYVRDANGKGLSLSATSLRTSAPENMTLGTLGAPWRDIFLSGVGSGQNGYTKLPNGFILQWGLTEITIPPTDKEALSQNVTLPVTFPTKSIATWAQVVNLTSQAGGAYKASFYSVISNVIDRATLWLYARTSNVSILTPTDTGLKIYWFALGH